MTIQKVTRRRVHIKVLKHLYRLWGFQIKLEKYHLFTILNFSKTWCLWVSIIHWLELRLP
ncbi:MAG: hypothetical protein ACTH7Q_15805 [Pseudoalteromonas sp.]